MKGITVLLPVLLALLAGAEPALAWAWPADGPVLQPFSFGGDPYAAGQHRGVDIGASPRSPVMAPAAGVVAFAGSVPGGGRTVTIRTPDGYAVTLVHLGEVAVVKGAAVAEGDTVGTVGPSGEPELAEPYVHVGVRVASDPDGYLDPLAFLPLRTGSPPAVGSPPAEADSAGGANAEAVAGAGTEGGAAEPSAAEPSGPESPPAPPPPGEETPVASEAAAAAASGAGQPGEASATETPVEAPAPPPPPPLGEAAGGEAGAGLPEPSAGTVEASPIVAAPEAAPAGVGPSTAAARLSRSGSGASTAGGPAGDRRSARPRQASAGERKLRSRAQASRPQQSPAVPGEAEPPPGASERSGREAASAGAPGPDVPPAPVALGLALLAAALFAAWRRGDRAIAPTTARPPAAAAVPPGVRAGRAEPSPTTGSDGELAPLRIAGLFSAQAPIEASQPVEEPAPPCRRWLVLHAPRASEAGRRRPGPHGGRTRRPAAVRRREWSDRASV